MMSVNKLISALKKHKSYLLLFLGRLYYRLAFLALTLVLSVVWERGDFGYYAAKMGTWILIDTLLISGMGVSIPKLLTRYSLLKTVLIRQSILITLLISVVVISVVSVIGVLLSHYLRIDFDMLDIMIICSLLAYAFCAVLQCIFRVVGKISYDYTASFVSGSFMVILAIFSFFFEMSPMTNVMFRLLYFIIINIYLTIKIFKLFPLDRKYSRRIYEISRLRIIKETMVMGFNGVVVDANISVINIVFRFNRLFEVAADFNIILAIVGPFLAFYRYFLFIIVPKIVEFARLGKNYFMDNYAKKVLFFAALTVVISVAAFIFVSTSGSGIIHLFILFLCRVPLLILFEAILIYLEAAVTKNLIFTARICLSGFIMCSISAFLLIPISGATGAIFALVLMDVVTITYSLISFYTSKKIVY